MAADRPVVDNNQPVCTFVFDREAYQPAFFKRLWEKYKIAIITYRKNVKDKWPDESFKSTDVKVMQQTVNMQLCELWTQLGGYWFREIRRLSEDGHQTAIITTHPTLETQFIAGRMFARWSQENFFRYLIQNYINKTLTVTLHSLSANRFNKAASELAKLLNQTETVFPGTNLQMIYKITAKSE